MDTVTLKNIMGSRSTFYFGEKRVKVIDFYDIFDFVDVVFEDEPERSTLVLPVKALTLEPVNEKYINLNQLFDMSLF